MFKNTYQSGLLSIFSSCGSNPLAIWDMEVHNGHVKRITDQEVNSLVLEIVSTNVATTYISCPKNNLVLGIRLPFLVMIVKNLKRYFSFEITVLDDRKMRRRFRISNFQTTTKIKPFCTTMPIGLSGGWNQIQFNLADFTRRAYGSQFLETLRVQVHANARLRRIYFSDRLYTEEELPQEYKLYLPLERKIKKKGVEKKEEAPSAAAAPAEGAAQVPESAPALPSAPTPAPAEEKPQEEKKEEAPAPAEISTEESAAAGDAPVQGDEATSEPAEGLAAEEAYEEGVKPGEDEAGEIGAVGEDTAPQEDEEGAEEPPPPAEGEDAETPAEAPPEE